MPTELTVLLSIGIGIAIGFIIGKLLSAQKQQKAQSELEHLQREMQSQRSQTSDAQEQFTSLDREFAVLQERLLQTQAQQVQQQELIADYEEQIENLLGDKHSKDQELSALQSQMQASLKHNEEKQEFLKQSIEQMEKQFKAAANEVLSNTGDKISKQQSEKLGDIMKPFREHLTRFEKEFKTAYDKETREQISLKEQIKHLGELNTKLSDEAHALANALKGDSKLRGNWGEQILEHILQGSGLREGHEYLTQASYHDEDGNRLQPDVIINLPDNKCVIIDSKVTLHSWMDVVNAESEQQRLQAMKAFHLAVQQHIRSLSNKAYHKIYDIQTLDFVLMFIPIETAFLYTLQHDQRIYEEAQQQNILLVSPTTLMAVLKTIAVNWKHDRQEKNTLRIAKEGEKLLDKIMNYMDTLTRARNSLQAANNHMELAFKRFATGKGNIKESTERLRELGIKSSKQMGVEWDRLDAEETHTIDAVVDGIAVSEEHVIENIDNDDIDEDESIEEITEENLKIPFDDLH